MGIGNFGNKLGSISVPGMESINKVLDEFNTALPTIRALGFSVEDLQISVGLLPKISAKLIASADDVDVKELDKIIKEKAELKMLVTVLKALQLAYNLKGPLGDLGLKGVVIDLKLGIPPEVGISFLKSTAAAKLAVATSA